MSSGINEISSQVERVTLAVNETVALDAKMGGMAATADQIGDVVKLITVIAGRTWRMRWKPCGRTWIRNLRMNSAVASVMIFWRSRPSARSSFHQGGRGNKNSEEKMVLPDRIELSTSPLPREFSV